jgi:hypothetical protein
MAPIGQNQLKSFQYIAELFNKSNPAGVKFEIVPFDNKVSPAESLTALKSATDQGIRYVTQGDGSGSAGALVDAINKNNERNPGKEVLFMNYAAVDPDLTNSKCSYWHFRLDADTSMKMEALTTYIKDQKDIHKVYIIGQNYAHGVQVAKYAKADLARKRPDIQVVGEDLHPLAKVTDFAPYVAKIKASGADTVITGNWGSDLSLLVKAANEAGLNVKFFTYYANNSHAHRARRRRRRPHLLRGLRPSQHGRTDRQAAGRLQGEVQRRLLRGRHLRRVPAAVGGDGQGQVHRPGEGGRGAGGPAPEELQRRHRDAQDRPPAAAGPVDLGVAEDRCEESVLGREHGLHLRPRRALRLLRREHAYFVPDEARRLTTRTI